MADKFSQTVVGYIYPKDAANRITIESEPEIYYTIRFSTSQHDVFPKVIKDLQESLAALDSQGFSNA